MLGTLSAGFAARPRARGGAGRAHPERRGDRLRRPGASPPRSLSQRERALEQARAARGRRRASSLDDGEYVALRRSLAEAASGDGPGGRDPALAHRAAALPARPSAPASSRPRWSRSRWRSCSATWSRARSRARWPRSPPPCARWRRRATWTRRSPCRRRLGRRGRARCWLRTFNTLTEAVARFQREAALRERLSALGRLSTVIAHEVRNPLMIIKGSLRVAAAGGRCRRRRCDEAVTDIDHEVARLNRIVDDVLDFARPVRAGVRARRPGRALPRTPRPPPCRATAPPGPDRRRARAWTPSSPTASACAPCSSTCWATPARRCAGGGQHGRRRPHRDVPGPLGSPGRWPDHGQGPGDGHRPRGPAARLRAVLHDQAHRHRPRPGDREEHRGGPGRHRSQRRAEAGQRDGSIRIELPIAGPAGRPDMDPRGSILLVDDEEGILKTLGRALRDEGHEVVAATSAREARAPAGDALLRPARRRQPHARAHGPGADPGPGGRARPTGERPRGRHDDRPRHRRERDRGHEARRLRLPAEALRGGRAAGGRAARAGAPAAAHAAPLPAVASATRSSTTTASWAAAAPSRS